jgi:hypothetical protein
METKSSSPKDIMNEFSGQTDKNSKALPISEINKAKATSAIHFDGNSTFYSLNEHEFETIKRGSNNIWKELTITSIALFIPLFSNTISEGMRIKWVSSSWNLFFNGLFTLTSLILIICFSIAWYNSKDEIKEIIERIETKPKFKI